jgi:peptidoglycan/xylan/chitin deacetylase (PgdA/CDA1 family)
MVKLAGILTEEKTKRYNRGECDNMGEKLKFIWAILVAFLVYGVIPSFLSRGFGVGSFRRSLALDKIAFTFDDGPDPEYTPQLLDLLKKYNIKATFFVLGRKAEQYLSLIHTDAADD